MSWSLNIGTLAASSEAHMVAIRAALASEASGQRGHSSEVRAPDTRPEPGSSARAMSRGVPVSTAMMTQYATLTPDAHVEEAVETLLRTSQSEFPVVDADGKPVGVLGRGDLIRALKERGPDARVAQAITGNMPTVSHRSHLEDAFRILQEKSAHAVAVVDAGGRLIGLVTSETVGEMMMLHEALPKGVRFGPWSRPA
jgi:CBS domain-containing protein